MKSTGTGHNFHIPVMGLAFTIDSPIRVAQYGIDSVVSIMDDELIEKMREFYSNKFKKPYEEIKLKSEDSRAKRITGYLNLMGEIVQSKYENFKQELSDNRTALEDFISTLPNKNTLKEKLESFLKSGTNDRESLLTILNNYLFPGSIDVNIMTKLDRENFVGKRKLDTIYNDAHAALRGFANSDLHSAIVFSAGMNPRLFGYMEEFEDFYPNENGQIKKKIILKVSDFRSAAIQGNFFAKKGLWVSEYRIESGLNCGGHAFATEGLLMGPILEEFKSKKEKLYEDAYSLLSKALENKGRPVPAAMPEIKYTVQGGVGTAEEHQFLLNHYSLDSVGWGSPFLLVPEATSLDDDTRKLLADAREEDLYLSNISPLGVPFNTIRGMTNDFYKNQRIEQEKAGSSCPKKFLALNTDYGEEGICPASKKFQDIKISELNEKYANNQSAEYQKEYNKITEKACLCVSLANASHLEHGIPIKGQKQGVSICPGPNMAYFSKTVSLKEMIHHIYNVKALEKHENRPHMFVKELGLYLEYFTEQIKEAVDINKRQIKKWEDFKSNLHAGIEYYKSLFEHSSFFQSKAEEIREQLESYRTALDKIVFAEPVAVE